MHRVNNWTHWQKRWKRTRITTGEDGPIAGLEACGPDDMQVARVILNRIVTRTCHVVIMDSTRCLSGFSQQYSKLTVIRESS